MAADLIKANKTPKRGNNTHPTSCFRHFNLKKREMNRHANDYKLNRKGKTLQTNMFPGELAKVKKEIANYFENKNKILLVRR